MSARAFTLAEPLAEPLALSFPDRRLALNQIRTHPKVRDRLRDEYKLEGARVAQAAIPAELRPVYPAGVALAVAVRCERARGGQRWDAAGIVEALKPAIDGMNGILWADDKQIAIWIVEWDARPTGGAQVFVTAHAVEGIG